MQRDYVPFLNNYSSTAYYFGSYLVACTLEAHVQFQPSLHGLCGGKVVLGHVLIKVPQFPLSVSFHQFTTVIHSILNDAIY